MNLNLKKKIINKFKSTNDEVFCGNFIFEKNNNNKESMDDNNIDNPEQKNNSPNFYSVFKNKFLRNKIFSFLKKKFRHGVLEYYQIKSVEWMLLNGLYGLLRYKVCKNDPLVFYFDDYYSNQVQIQIFKKFNNDKEFYINLFTNYYYSFIMKFQYKTTLNQSNNHSNNNNNNNNNNNLIRTTSFINNDENIEKPILKKELQEKSKILGKTIELIVESDCKVALKILVEKFKYKPENDLVYELVLHSSFKILKYLLKKITFKINKTRLWEIVAKDKSYSLNQKVKFIIETMKINPPDGFQFTNNLLFDNSKCKTNMYCQPMKLLIETCITISTLEPQLKHLLPPINNEKRKKKKQSIEIIPLKKLNEMISILDQSQQQSFSTTLVNEYKSNTTIVNQLFQQYLNFTNLSTRQYLNDKNWYKLKIQLNKILYEKTSNWKNEFLNWILYFNKFNSFFNWSNNNGFYLVDFGLNQFISSSSETVYQFLNSIIDCIIKNEKFEHGKKFFNFLATLDSIDYFQFTYNKLFSFYINNNFIFGFEIFDFIKSNEIFKFVFTKLIENQKQLKQISTTAIINKNNSSCCQFLKFNLVNGNINNLNKFKQLFPDKFYKYSNYLELFNIPFSSCKFIIENSIINEDGIYCGFSKFIEYEQLFTCILNVGEMKKQDLVYFIKNTPNSTIYDIFRISKSQQFSSLNWVFKNRNSDIENKRCSFISPENLLLYYYNSNLLSTCLKEFNFQYGYLVLKEIGKKCDVTFLDSILKASNLTSTSNREHKKNILNHCYIVASHFGHIKLFQFVYDNHRNAITNCRLFDSDNHHGSDGGIDKNINQIEKTNNNQVIISDFYCAINSNNLDLIYSYHKSLIKYQPF